MDLPVSLLLLFLVLSVSEGSRRGRYLSSEKCNVTREEVYESLQALLMVGDSDMILPKDHCDVLTHCDKVVSHAKKTLNHLKCVDGGAAKALFTILSRAYVNEYGERCTSKVWREKYLKFSKCVQNGKNAADIDQCAYRTHDMFKYAVENYPPLDQVPLSCCGVQLMAGCLHKQIAKDCDHDDAEFGPELFWGPISSAFSFACPELESLRLCRKHYPKAMKQFDKIMNSNKRLSPRNFMKWAFLMHHNRGHQLPEAPQGTEE